MIKCPPNQPVTYTLSINLNRIRNPFANLGLVGVSELFLMSYEISDDMTALNELMSALSALMVKGMSCKIAYAPAHYQVSQDLSDAVELNDETGNVASIGGFTNPFDMIDITILDSHDELIGEGTISMEPFEFTQSMEEIITETILLH